MATEIFEGELRHWQSRGAFLVLGRSEGPFGDRFTIDTGTRIIDLTEDDLRFLMLGLTIADRGLLFVPADSAVTPSAEVMA